MRDFNKADRAKKKSRIRIRENPGNLSGELLSELEKTVKKSLKGGYLPCPVAWGIAKKFDIPRIAVGETADRLGIRVTDCQLGCFKVEKTVYDASSHEIAGGDITGILDAVEDKDNLTCAAVFELAGRYGIKPLAIANTMSARGHKIHDCQLGCF